MATAARVGGGARVEVAAPAAEARDVLGVRERRRLRTGSPARDVPSSSSSVPIAERRGNRRDEAAERGDRQLPDLDVDRVAAGVARAPGPAWAASCRAARTGDSAAPCARARTRRAPRSVSSRLSGSPDRCAPTTASCATSARGRERLRRAGIGDAERAERQAACRRGSAAPSSASIRSLPRGRDQRDAERQRRRRASPPAPRSPRGRAG